MKRRQVEEGRKNSTERWLLTYSDLITLLMIFFVLMYTISNVNAQKFAGLANSLRSALEGRENKLLDYAGPSIVDGMSGEEIQMAELAAKLEKYVEEEGLGERIGIRIEERGLVVSIRDTLLFPKGSADLTPEAREIIRKLGLILLQTSNFLRIEGHTDNLPIHTAQFPSNWELSAARATNVVQVLVREIKFPPERLSTTGYGEYRPVSPNDNEEHRAENRRVDLVLLKSELVVSEPQRQEPRLSQSAGE
jgi:chemotaxis protein MotB